MKTIIPFLLLIFRLGLWSGNTMAQNPDLPNPASHITEMPAGSLVIAMDNTHQALPGYFNLKAYGLVVTLMNADKRLRWIIRSGKAKDETDFTVNAEKVYPVTEAVSLKSFKAGPFVIFAGDVAGVETIINNFNNSQTAGFQVNVFRTTEAVNVDVRYDMLSRKPKAAILNDGGNHAIHESYMINASIPTSSYLILPSATLLMETCFTFASEPHNDGTKGNISAIVDSIIHMVKIDGGNFLAECHAIETYENDQQGLFQSTTGLNAHTNPKINSNVFYANPDLAYAQFEGFFDPNQGGYTQTYFVLPGGDTANHFYPVIRGGAYPLDTVFGASVAKFKPGFGGLVFYLGNHDLGNGHSIEELNGQRMYLNAFLIPARYPACPPGGPLAVEWLVFNGKKINNLQAELYWKTANEYGTSQYSIQRSSNGLDFTQIGNITLPETTSGEGNSYHFTDQAPLRGFNFYRIAEVDSKGRVSYSRTIMLDFGSSYPGMAIYPNPATQVIQVELNDLPLINNSLQVYDITGKKVIGDLLFSGNSIRLDISRLLSGIYIANIRAANGVVVKCRFSVLRN